MDCRLLCQATVQYVVIRSSEELATSLFNYNLTTEAEIPPKHHKTQNHIKHYMVSFQRIFILTTFGITKSDKNFLYFLNIY
jgi:hypothetical protein